MSCDRRLLAHLVYWLTAKHLDLRQSCTPLPDILVLDVIDGDPIACSMQRPVPGAQWRDGSLTRIAYTPIMFFVIWSFGARVGYSPFCCMALPYRKVGRNVGHHYEVVMSAEEVNEESLMTYV